MSFQTANPNRLPFRRLLIVTGSLHGGGSEKQVYYIAKAAQMLGLRSAVVTLQENGIWQRRIEEDLGQRVRVLPQGPRWWRLIQLARLARSFRAEMVHTVHFYAGAYMTMAKLFRRMPVIVSLRTSHELLHRRTRWFERALNFYGADAVVSNSWAVIHALRKRTFIPIPLYYLPNAIAISGPPVQPVWRRGEPFRLIFIGNISHGKNASLLLKVVRELHREGYPIRGMIAGKGQMLGAVIDEAERLGVSDFVEFHGHVSDVYSLLRQAHAFFFPSLNEGMPNAVMEAVAAGIPVVSSRVGDVPRLIEDGKSGLLFERNNVMEAFEKTRWLIDRYDALMPVFTREALSRLKAHHAFEQFPHRLKALYLRIYNRYHGIR